jgi:Zn-dependent peptidase ImmA (M78 family)
MGGDYASAIRGGTIAAGRLHRELGLRERIKAQQGGNIDVFGSIVALDLPLLLRPLKNLLGAYLRDPTHGVLVTTQRPLSMQRFTAAHELGHYYIGHKPSLDDEDILRRSPFAAQTQQDLQEVEANAFAAAFLMPRWLIAWHGERQGWHGADYTKSDIIYQLALRLGTSFEATCWTLQRYKLIDPAAARQAVAAPVRQLKEALLQEYQPADFHRDVWLLTTRDAGTVIAGSRTDLFVLRLEEHSGGGYLWDVEQLKASGFAIVQDACEAIPPETIGSHTVRRITTTLDSAQSGRVALDERRPWQPAQPLNQLVLFYDLTGPEEEGLSRAERRLILKTAA